MKVTSTLGNDGGDPLTMEQIMVQMEDMRRENAKARRESVEAMKVVGEALQANDTLRQQNLKMQLRVDQAQASLEVQASNLRLLEGVAEEQPRDLNPFQGGRIEYKDSSEHSDLKVATL